MAVVDMHVHTTSSPDAEVSAAELCTMGRNSGIDTIGFVAHVDLHPEDHCYGIFSEASFLKELDRAEDRGSAVLRGLEVGEPHRYLDQAELIFSRGRYDFITGALHWIDYGLVLDQLVFRHENPLAVVEKYYAETLSIVRDTDVNILAHMGIFRRGMARAGLATDLDEVKLFPTLVKDILQTMINRGVALEVNTAGLRRPEQTTYPTTEVLQLYRKLGGTRITVGSDTHKRHNAFFGISMGLSLLTYCGYTSYGYFKKAEYVPTPLPGR